MSGHGALGQPSRSNERSAPRRRSGRLVVAVTAASLAAFGAVAGASAHDDPVGHDTRTAVVTTDNSSSDPAGTLPGEPPDDLGNDAELDALAQQCFDGELIACDTLFLQSPGGSPYEEYGDTCGGRQESGTEEFCALTVGDDTDEPGPAIEPVPPQELGTDPALDALANDCYVGDMDACDQLYADAEADSPYQIYGDTCAGRQDEGTGQYCRDLDAPVPGTGPVDSTTPETSSTVEVTAPVETTGAPSTDVVTTAVETTVVGPTAPTAPPVTGGAIPPPTQQPIGLGSDPALDALAQRCYDGEMVACDDLYKSSEADTPYRTFADTCAGRQPEGTGVWCDVAFGGGPTAPTVPTATVPPLTVPPVTVPPVTVTPVTVPPVTVPPVTVPPVTVPPVTVPPVTVPPVTVPPVTVPPVTVPSVTVPSVTAPPVTLPPVTAPGDTSPATPPTTSGALGVVPLPTLQPVGLGTDPTLDALAQGCYNGDLASCDELWRQSEPDSNYRNFGDTCAGRQPPQTGRWCVDAFAATVPTTVDPTATTTGPAVTVVGGIPPATQQPVGLGADPALDSLAQACYNGDMEACDDLFRASALGSPYQNYGDTCAGRQPPGTFTYCDVAFPVEP